MSANEHEQAARGDQAEAEVEVEGHAYNAFVNFGDIKGESQDDRHKDWIEVLSYSHGTGPAAGHQSSS